MKPLYRHGGKGQAVLAEKADIFESVAWKRQGVADWSGGSWSGRGRVLYWCNKSWREQYKKVFPPGQTSYSVTSSAADFQRNTKFF